MHPVTSELDLSIRRYEQQLSFQAIQRAQLASEAARLSGQAGPISRLIKSVRQFLDPRGVALAQALRISRATAEIAAANPASATIRAFPQATERSADSWRKAA